MASALKPGSTSDFAASMAEAMFVAMQKEWQAAHGSPLPGGAGELDRRIMFAAIAQGVLGYLEDHRGDLVTTVVQDASGGHSHTMAFDVDGI